MAGVTNIVARKQQNVLLRLLALMRGGGVSRPRLSERSENEYCMPPADLLEAIRKVLHCKSP
eukprot:scaffold33738_cov54-Attheya_sp.AAC.1